MHYQVFYFLPCSFRRAVYFHQFLNKQHYLMTVRLLLRPCHQQHCHVKTPISVCNTITIECDLFHSAQVVAGSVTDVQPAPTQVQSPGMILD